MRSRAAVLYDGQCRLCTASVRRLRALDLGRRLEFGDARDAAVLARHPQVDASRALVRMQLVPVPGAPPIEGFSALTWIAGRLPTLWIAWPVLRLLGVLRLGDRLYDALARRRLFFGTCEDACVTGDAPPARH